MFDPTVLSSPGTVLLDTARPDAENQRSLCFTAPKETLIANSPEEVGPLLDALEGYRAQGAYAAGYLGYEAGYPFVGLEPPAWEGAGPSVPVAWFGIYDRPVVLAPAEVDRGLDRLRMDASVDTVQMQVSRTAYTQAIERIYQHIADGDVYQINYTTPVHFEVEGDPRALYRRLRQRQRVPYGAYVNLGKHQILSCSPELFFRQHKRTITTRPMKGTTRRGRTLEEDRRLQQKLAADPKNRAENLMIVDLLRNDLSVICEPGSVTVPELYATEPYDTVTQMTSTVRGRLRREEELRGIVSSLFPCGSVTGAPKRRAMRIIRTLEDQPRGVYCGAIGLISPDDEACFSVAIRTVVVEEGRGKMGVGSGIVWDSDPEDEYEECVLKTQFLTSTSESAQISSDDSHFRLIETMRYDGIRIPLLDRHISRIADSATYFNVPFSAARFRSRVRSVTARLPADSIAKIRVTVDRWGRIQVESSPLEDEGAEPWELAISEERVDSSDPLFYHKTSQRQVYDRARAAVRGGGADEVLLRNEDGEITEGTYSNVFIRRGEDLLTPPVSAGLLGGVYRAYVLETTDHAYEQPLTVDDLKTADEIYCCNAVRGWCRARLVRSSVPKDQNEP